MDHEKNLPFFDRRKYRRGVISYLSFTAGMDRIFENDRDTRDG